VFAGDDANRRAANLSLLEQQILRGGPDQVKYHSDSSAQREASAAAVCMDYRAQSRMNELMFGFQTFASGRCPGSFRHVKLRVDSNASVDVVSPSAG
jgi:hypothetical protein